MDFSHCVKDEFVKISARQYAPNVCPFCKSRKISIRTSHERTIFELGNIDTRRIVKLHTATFQCEKCGRKYIPQHPDYPKILQYSRRVIQTALSMHFKKNLSGNKIAAHLAEYFNVQVPPKTIFSWINTFTEDFMKASLKRSPLRR